MKFTIWHYYSFSTSVLPAFPSIFYQFFIYLLQKWPIHISDLGCFLLDCFLFFVFSQTVSNNIVYDTLPSAMLCKYPIHSILLVFKTPITTVSLCTYNILLYIWLNLYSSHNVLIIFQINFLLRDTKILNFCLVYASLSYASEMAFMFLYMLLTLQFLIAVFNAS